MLPSNPDAAIDTGEEFCRSVNINESLFLYENYGAIINTTKKGI